MTIDAVFGAPLPEVVIEGDRHGLRPFRPDDLALVEEAAGNDFIPTITTIETPFTVANGLAYIERQNFRLSSGEGWSLAIVDRPTDRAVGQIGLWISQLRKGRAEIGYWVAPSHRRRGAASEAVQLFSDWAFEQIDVDRLSLFIEPWNVASQSTAARAGFREEALLASWERIDGKSKDMLSFVRLRSPG